MSEIPHEQLVTRAFGGLFMASRPRLRELATDVLRSQVVSEDRISGRDPFGESRLVQLRPTGGIAPDLVLHDENGTRARVIFEVKLHANAQAPLYASCEGLGHAEGACPQEVRDAYATGHIAESGRGGDGVWQIDAYFAWRWWDGRQIPDDGRPLEVVPDETVFVLLSLNGISPHGMFAGAPGARYWAAVDLRQFLAEVHHKSDAYAVNRAELDALAALTFLAFAADYASAAADPDEWISQAMVSSGLIANRSQTASINPRDAC